MCDITFLPPVALHTGCITRRTRTGKSKRPRVRVRLPLMPPSTRLRRVVPLRMDATKGYVPSDDDRPEGASKTPRELTLSQELLMKSYEEQVERMSKEEADSLALEVARQMIVKDNILKAMLKKEIDTGVEPLDPREFMEGDGDGDESAKEAD